MEELILQVLHKDCLQHLRRLKRLNSLVLECTLVPLNTDRRFPLNVVIDKCENLETLGVLELKAINLPLKNEYYVVRATFRHLERINIVIDAFYRQVKLPTDRIISKLLYRHGDSDSLRYVSFSNNRQHEGLDCGINARKILSQGCRLNSSTN
ncbi:hypothetical protein CEXT_311111 [Caerostris extrusa]|uniref:Uncharacterized protein n=1 Tax=Caerostris extrusa TaxID=172846 RepID=A0AAV4PRJ6_CAEEX|nr:hypothetical protein CEXT_311111 [Caerostris extrusa]